MGRKKVLKDKTIITVHVERWVKTEIEQASKSSMGIPYQMHYRLALENYARGLQKGVKNGRSGNRSKDG